MVRGISTASAHNLKTYCKYAQQHVSGEPFPISRKNLINYLTFKSQTNTFSSIRTILSGLDQHPKHKHAWLRNVRNHKDVLELLQKLRQGECPVETQAKDPTRDSSGYTCLVVNGFVVTKPDEGSYLSRPESATPTDIPVCNAYVTIPKEDEYELRLKLEPNMTLLEVKEHCPVVSVHVSTGLDCIRPK
ncbi:hypothetical protein DFQ28_007009 [Apophysomyces sp. BC1034]|nr:hypothetical protein DFQ30_009612 [Apophysomyces sp. BC1015]KAG0182199.1 hypothetical protein DFQ29_005254 [Apophysomyces sp. BC1021]KAG0192977.1 hypothetical protein DFQ28_007009 [Apophysomyces sp. BC1034]